MQFRFEDQEQKVQLIYTALLYSHRFVELWKSDGGAVLQGFGVEQSHFKDFPDVRSLQHAAEMRGRRVPIVRAIREFEDIIVYLSHGHEIALEQISLAPWLDRFLSSPYFLDPNTFLVMNSPIGEGFDQKAKFLAWLVDSCGLHSAFGDERIKKIVYDRLAISYLAEDSDGSHLKLDRACYYRLDASPCKRVCTRETTESGRVNLWEDVSFRAHLETDIDLDCVLRDNLLKARASPVCLLIPSEGPTDSPTLSGGRWAGGSSEAL